MSSPNVSAPVAYSRSRSQVYGSPITRVTGTSARAMGTLMVSAARRRRSESHSLGFGASDGVAPGSGISGDAVPASYWILCSGTRHRHRTREDDGDAPAQP